MPGAPFTNWIALAALGFVVVLMASAPDTRLGIYVWLGWFGLLVTGYLLSKRSRVRTRTSA